jgi:phenylpropionate dioxygenase-like ring-hydroxylating dioxygenase large terminal subunit
MLNTRQKVLRNFWYAALPVDKLKDGPKPFRLLGHDVLLFIGEGDALAALGGPCCHRTAKLLKGCIKNGHIVCGYYGWEYDSAGKLRNIPQFPSGHPLPDARAKAFRARERYGYVWVCLGEPLSDISDLPQERAPAFRRIHRFDEVWKCSALRMMENSFDNSHFSFVQRARSAISTSRSRRNTS